MNVASVHRYYNPQSHDHFYTTNEQEIGTTTKNQSGKYNYIFEGPGFTVFTHPNGDYGELIPVYRYYQGDVYDHFYTTNEEEIGTVDPQSKKGKNDYISEGILGYVSPHAFPGSVPIHRYYQPDIKDHFYTVEANEIGTLEVGHTNRNGYTYEGVLGYVYPAEHHVIPIYRYLQPEVQDHFYTTSPEEIGTMTYGQKGRYGYVSEGVAFNIFTHHLTGLVPMHRYYHKSCKDHFYTTNGGEIGTTEIGKIGHHNYEYEGVVGYCSPLEFSGGVPVFRYYNGATKDHFYTTNVADIGTTTDGATGSHGYTCEGILGYFPQ